MCSEDAGLEGSEVSDRMDVRFGSDVVEAASRDLVIGIRAGDSGHRFTPVWSVVADGRVFARSWGLSPTGWNATLPDRSTVTVQIGGAELAATAVRVRDEHVNDLVDEMYRSKYHTAASAKYVEDLASPASRASTMEFLPDAIADER